MSKTVFKITDKANPNTLYYVVGEHWQTTLTMFLGGYCQTADIEEVGLDGVPAGTPIYVSPGRNVTRVEALWTFRALLALPFTGATGNKGLTHVYTKSFDSSAEATALADLLLKSGTIVGYAVEYQVKEGGTWYNHQNKHPVPDEIRVQSTII